MNENKMCFLRQHSNKLNIYNNQYEEGFTTLCYHLKTSDNIKEVKTTDEFFEIDGIDEPGEYIFWLKNQNNEETTRINIYLLAESISKTIDKINNYIIKPIDEIYINGCFEIAKDLVKKHNSITETLVYMYRNVEDIQKYEAKSFYQMISIAERYENIQVLSSNEMIQKTSFRHGAISEINPSVWVDYIDIIKKDNDIETFIKRIDRKDFDDIVYLELEEDSLYSIDFYNENDLIGSFIHYRFDNKGLAYFWNEEIEATNKIDEKMFDDLKLYQSDIKLTETEKRNIIEEKIKESRNWIIPRPKIEDVALNGVMTINIEEYDLLKAMGKQFYISLKEPELFLNDGFDRKIKIKDNRFQVNLNEHGIYNRAIIAIKDENRNILSKFTRYDKDISFIDEEQNKAKLESIIFSNKIIKKMSQFIHDLEFMNELENNMYVSYSDPLSDSEKMFYRTIYYLLTADHVPVSRNALINSIIEDWMDQFETDLNFFEINTFYFFNARKELIVPPRKDPFTVVRIDFSLDNDLPNITYKKNTPGESMPIKTDLSELSIIYCIDNTTYKRSGFFLINNIINEKCLVSNAFYVEEDPIER